jgi:hypothetical protein
MGFFIQLTDAIAERQSLLVTGLDPNPEMLQSWAHRRGMGGRSFLSQARQMISRHFAPIWIKAATDVHMCPPVLELSNGSDSLGCKLFSCHLHYSL